MTEPGFLGVVRDFGFRAALCRALRILFSLFFKGGRAESLVESVPRAVSEIGRNG